MMSIEIINQCIMRTCELFTKKIRKETKCKCSRNISARRVWAVEERRKKDRRSLKLNDNYKFDTPRHSDLRDQNLNNEILVQIKITGGDELRWKICTNNRRRDYESEPPKEEAMMEQPQQRGKNKKNDFQKSNYIQICWWKKTRRFLTFSFINIRAVTRDRGGFATATDPRVSSRVQSAEVFFRSRFEISLLPLWAQWSPLTILPAVSRWLLLFHNISPLWRRGPWGTSRRLTSISRGDLFKWLLMMHHCRLMRPQSQFIDTQWASAGESHLINFNMDIWVINARARSAKWISLVIKLSAHVSLLQHDTPEKKEKEKKKFVWRRRLTIHHFIMAQHKVSFFYLSLQICECARLSNDRENVDELLIWQSHENNESSVEESVHKLEG
jgi:hypothetical protein